MNIINVNEMMWSVMGNTTVVLLNYNDNNEELYRGLCSEYPREYRNWVLEDFSVIDGVVKLIIR